jgi:hypothetical protein
MVNVKPGLLQGDYKDRRLVWFHSLKEIMEAKEELQRIVKELVKMQQM